MLNVFKRTPRDSSLLIGIAMYTESFYVVATKDFERAIIVLPEVRGFDTLALCEWAYSYYALILMRPPDHSGLVLIAMDAISSL